MAQIFQTHAQWTTTRGGVGYSTFYTTAAGSHVSSIRSFFDNMKSLLPVDVSVQVQSQGDIFEDSTGAVTGSWTENAVGLVSGTDVGVYSAPSGACVNWNTNTIHYRRRLHGRTFVVPLAGLCYDDTGYLSTDAIANLEQSATNLRAALGNTFVVWGRPKLSKDANGEVTVQRPGASGPVQAHKLSPTIAHLQSRQV